MLFVFGFINVFTIYGGSVRKNVESAFPKTEEVAMRMAVVLLLVGCQGMIGPPGAQGPPGPAGTNVNAGGSADGGLTGQATNCTPATNFCDGNRLWSCTRSGTDAVVGQDCAASGSVNNPYTCATTGCWYGSPSGCCQATKPLCNWNITGPASLSGKMYYTVGPLQGQYCSAPSVTPGCTVATGTFSMSFSEPQPNTCPAASRGLSVSIQRSMVTIGQAIMMPSAAVSISYVANDPAHSCSTWTGTVTLNSDVPSYLVTLSLTCSESGKTGVTVTGTVQGDV